MYQLKSLESTLAGSLRREHVADASIKKLEAEIEHLNRLVISFSPTLLPFPLMFQSFNQFIFRFDKERKILGAQK